MVQTTLSRLSDRFVTKINTAASGGASLVWSTYLGGTGFENPSAVGLTDDGAIAVDGSGNVYVTGSTSSSDFPMASAIDASCGSNGTCNGNDATYTDGVSTSASTTYTSATARFSSNDVGLAISGSNIPAGTLVAGVTDATTISLSQAATVSSTASFTLAKRLPRLDAFLSKLNSTGTSLLYSSYVGGGEVDQGRSIALGASGIAFVAGPTASRDLNVSGAVPAYDATCGTDGACNATNYTNTMA